VAIPLAIACSGATASANSLTVTKLGSDSGDGSFYNTFGPWDQYVVYDGSYGVFAIYHTTQNDESDPGCHCGYFRVVRSTDGGTTWSTVFDSQASGTQVQSLAIDKDAAGDIYVTGSNIGANGWQTHLWHFAAGSFSSPTHVLLPYGSSKYSMIYDPAHNQLDLALWENDPNPNFIAVDASTLAVARKVTIFKSRASTCCATYDDVEYETLSAGPGGRILFGWTTEDVPLANSGTQNYYDAHFLVSSDGGATWTGPKGQVTLPIYGSDSNSYEIINTSDSAEFYPHGSSSYKGNWDMLDTVLWNDDGVAAAYGGFAPSSHASFAWLNWNTRTWVNRTDAQTTAEGDACQAHQQSDGGLSQTPAYTGVIYRMCHENAPGGGTRVLADVSSDDGATWHTFATSSWTTGQGWVYLDPSHVIGPDGQLGAVFTLVNSPTSSDVYFVQSQPTTPPPPPPTTTTIEAETITGTSRTVVFSDPTASAGKGIYLTTDGNVTKTVTTGALSNITVRAEGMQCSGAPQMTVAVDGRQVGATQTVSNTAWQNFSIPVSLPSGQHTITVTFPNDEYQAGVCDRNLALDDVTLTGS
jgi:hypothetical protein